MPGSAQLGPFSGPAFPPPSEPGASLRPARPGSTALRPERLKAPSGQVVRLKAAPPRAVRPRHALAGLVLAALLASACTFPGRAPVRPPAPAETPPALRIVATLFPYADLARSVAGPRAQVTALVPDGAEAHDWEPRPSDVLRLREADLVIYNGAGMEPWLPRLLAGLPPDRPARLEAAAGLPLLPAPPAALPEPTAGPGAPGSQGAHPEAHGLAPPGTPDPHIWLDPVLLQEVVARLGGILARLDPAGTQAYRQRAQELAAELAQVDRAYREALTRCRQRTLVVTHGFFTYPAARYGLNQVALLGPEPEREPSPRTLARLAQWAREEGVRTVFAETRVGRRVAEALAAEAGLQVRTLHPMESLTPEERAQGLTLLDLFRRNLEELKAGLDCG